MLYRSDDGISFTGTPGNALLPYLDIHVQHRADGVRGVFRSDRLPAGGGRPAAAPGARPGPVPPEPPLRVRRAVRPVHRAADRRLPRRPVAQRAAAERLLATAARPARRRRRARRVLGVQVRQDGGQAETGAVAAAHRGLRPRPAVHRRLGRLAARPRVLRRQRPVGLLQRHGPAGRRR